MVENQARDVKARVIESATALFSQKGYEGAKMSEIAQNAGIKKALIYYYFPSKQSILDYIIDMFFLEMMGLSMDFIRNTITRMIEEGALDILSDRLRFTTAANLDAFRQQMLTYCAETLAFSLQHRDVLRIVLSESLRNGERQDAVFRFFQLSERGSSNPLYQAVYNADADFDYSDAAVFRRFFFLHMPMLSFAVFYDDYISISGMEAPAMLDAFLASISALISGRVRGLDIMLDTAPIS